MDRSDIKNDLHKLLKPGRFEHTLAVEYTACCLAMRYGADIQKAELAGLIHDCAKAYAVDQYVKMAQDFGISLEQVEIDNPQLIHAKLGAY